MAVDLAVPADESVEDADQVLLRRHRPRLLWDSQEDFRAIAAESITEGPGNVLEAEGRVVARQAADAGPRLSLDLLGDGIAGIDLENRARFRQGPSPFAVARQFQRDGDRANRVYGRVVRREDRIFLQYWLWFYYCTGNPLGYGHHEGDWKVIQVALNASEEPVAATCAQVSQPEIRDDVTKIEWEHCVTPCTEGCRHPRIYIAPFSHGLYFEPGTHISSSGVDNPDGLITADLPLVEEFGTWASWPGEWGGNIFGRGLGRSPRSPGCQTERWDPEKFERRARRSSPRETRWLWRFGRRTYPHPPRIDMAVQRGDSVVVHWYVRRKLKLRPTWLLITVHEAAVPSEVIRRRIARVRGSAGETAIPLDSGHPNELHVRATAFNGLRQRSDGGNVCDVERPSDVGNGGVRDEWSQRVRIRFQHELLKHLAGSGAATVSELEARRIHVLELPLNRQELLTVIDSARRAGLVEPVPEARRGDSSSAADPEWTATEEGRHRTMPFGRWLGRSVLVVPPAILLALSQGAVLPWLKKQHWVFALSFAVALLTIAIGLGLLFYRRLGGASNREVARQWSRHAVELPSLNRQHTWWTAGKVVAGLLGVLAYAGGAALVGWGVGLSGAAAVVTLAFGWTLAAAGLAALTWMYAFAFVRLVTRSDVRREAKAWREAAGSPPEPTPLDAVRALRQRQRRGR